MKEDKIDYYTKLTLEQSYYAVINELQNTGAPKNEIQEILKILKANFLNNPINKQNLFSTDIPIVNIPEQMTIGIEIETFATTTLKTSKCFEDICLKNDMLEIVRYLGWNTGHDQSIIWNVDGKEMSDGIEITSPILNSEEYNIGEEVNNICKLAELSNCDVNKTCGIHVHIGANYLDSAQTFMNLLEIWCNNEDLLYLIGSAQNDLIRESAIREVNPQADCWSKLVKNAVENGSLDLDKNNTVFEIKRKLMEFQSLNPTISNSVDSDGRSPAKRQRGMNYKSNNNEIKYKIKRSAWHIANLFSFIKIR